MDEPGHFDFKRPIGAQNDHRTSTYRGHLKLPEQVSEPINHDFSLKHKQYIQSIGDEEQCLTESQEQFSWKILKPSNIRNPTVNGIHFMKSFKESNLRNTFKLMPNLSSVSQRDYQWKSKALEEYPPVIQLATEANTNIRICIDRCKSGFGKLLDPSATTNNLAYRAYSTAESGISSKNIITFWNWKNTFKKKHNYCNVAHKCCVHRREYQNSVKHVPNSGLITEAKSKYVQHLNLTNSDSFHMNKQFINYIGVPNQAKSENTIYGSGIPIQKYLA